MAGLVYYGRVFYFVFSCLIREYLLAILASPVGLIAVLGAGCVFFLGLLERMAGLVNCNTGGLIRRITTLAMIRFTAVVSTVGL